MDLGDATLNSRGTISIGGKNGVIGEIQKTVREPLDCDMKEAVEMILHYQKNIYNLHLTAHL